MSEHRHLVSTAQLDRSWVEGHLFPLCDRLRQAPPDPVLHGRAVYCLFYEPSFVTRTSFERATELLGGRAYHTEDATQFFPISTPNYVDNVTNMLASLHMDLVVLRTSEPGAVERAAEADALPIINGGSLDDHPTQALADLYTLRRELGGVDGVHLAVVGRLEHRNVSALLRGLAMFRGVRVTLLPMSGQLDPEVADYCQERDVTVTTAQGPEALAEADAIYLNGPRTSAHARLLKSRGALDLRIDADFMARLKPHCVIMDPMQRSGDFEIAVADGRLAFYRQAENALILRMALLAHLLEAL